MTSLEEEPDTTESSSLFLRVLPYLEKIWAVMVQFRFIIVIGLLAFWVKVGYTHSIDMSKLINRRYAFSFTDLGIFHKFFPV